MSFFEVCRHVVPTMKRAGYGRVVNMTSIAGKEGTPFRSAYSAAKAGVIAFTKSLAKELADTDIRINAIAPATIDTEIFRQLSPDDVRALIEKSPMKRLGTVDEVAEIALWCTRKSAPSAQARHSMSPEEERSIDELAVSLAVPTCR